MAELTLKVFEGKTIESIDQGIEIGEELILIKFTDGNVLKINSYSEDAYVDSGLAWEIDSWK
jgi:hypothetical protein